MTHLFAVLVFTSFFSGSVTAKTWQDLDPGPLQVNLVRAGLVAPLDDKTYLTQMLQLYFDKVYGVGFLHFGHMADSGHGHPLFDRQGQLVAILYHTQEIRLRLSPVDRAALHQEKRNWIQWIAKPDRVEDATIYRYDSAQDYPGEEGDDTAPLEQWNNFTEHFTITSRMLDRKKLGVALSEAPRRGFYMNRVICPSKSYKEISADQTNIVEIQQKALNRRLCVAVLGIKTEEQRDYEHKALGSDLAGPPL